MSEKWKKAWNQRLRKLFELYTELKKKLLTDKNILRPDDLNTDWLDYIQW